MPLLQASGPLTFLRVHETGTRYGPPTDQLDVEIIFGIKGKDGAFGFQLRDNAAGPARRAMLDLLRDAFAHEWVVHTDYEIDAGRKNGTAIRVWLTRPQPASRPGTVTGVVSPIVVTAALNNSS